MREGTRAAILFACLGLGAAGPRSAGAAPIRFDPAKMISVDEIKPGMKGVARTVFEGTRIEEFEVDVLSVVRGTSSDGDIILVQAKGDKVEHTGIAAGMSGSPVYLDGRLAGAIALGWSFSKDAVAGVTPIAQMIRSTEVSDSSRRVELEPQRAADSRRMTPLPLLLDARGRGEAWAEGADSLLTPMGLRLSDLARSGAASMPESSGDLVPGAAVAIDMVTGDLEMSAVGTVTYREGDQVLCFGHPLFQVGSVTLPLSTAFIHTILSSTLSSMKMASAGRVVGALTEDRAYAVRGIVGSHADQLPVTLDLTDEDGERKLFHYGVMRHPGFTANLAGLSLLDGLATGAGGLPKIAMPYEATVSFAGGQRISWRDQPVSATGPPAMDIARDVAQRLNLLLNNTWQSVRIDSVRVSATVRPGSHSVGLETAWLLQARAHAGDRIGVAVRVRPERGETHVETLEMNLPQHMPAGRYKLLVGDVDARVEAERLRAPGVFHPTSLGQALDLLRLRTTHAALYAALYSDDTGASVRGNELPALPGSSLAALGDGRVGGGVQWVRSRLWAEASKPLENTLSGSFELNLEIESEGP